MSAPNDMSPEEQQIAKRWWIRGILMGVCTSVLILFPLLYAFFEWMDR